jgi:hypothetical protein
MLNALLFPFLKVVLCVPRMVCRIFQLKVGGSPSDDIARIHAVRAMLDAKVTLGSAVTRIDLSFSSVLLNKKAKI